ncbi:Hypothetical_protein [Hexamita inflata]|uniref:Hypothetical_protein n=1 Tax=Hexamita inflata TaxID=28002 RepID=A0AA86PPG4_9EUKA|nr:Hypothetical protein HINF_LOCUS28673 [Hexamita inflata]CAI9967543.1 Hypothetical protein HINF_LOCUS55188 [Hexamita inflata]
MWRFQCAQVRLVHSDGFDAIIKIQVGHACFHRLQSDYDLIFQGVERCEHRIVGFIFEQDAGYNFVDEVEVHKGDKAVNQQYKASRCHFGFVLAGAADEARFQFEQD